MSMQISGDWHTDEVEGAKIQTREVIEFAGLYDYSPVSYPAYKQTNVDARSRKLAFQHRPVPEAPEEVVGASNEIAQERIKRSLYGQD